MAASDPRADAVLNGIARDVTRGGFTVSVLQGPGAARARQIASDLIARLNLCGLVTDIVREDLRDGDGFHELAVDAAGLIQSLTRKPTLEMRRMSDLDDVFHDPTRAFAWSDIIYVQDGLAPPKDALLFAEWQIIHARWAHDAHNRYGLPLFASAQAPWQYASEGERDMAIRRKTRAGMRYIHVLEGAGEGEIAAYVERNKQALTDPNVATADFFTTKPGGISSTQGDAHLSEIGDVSHQITTAYFNSILPLYLLGYGESLNRDVLQQMQEQYDRALDGVAAWLDDQMLIPLIERQWLLQGIWPASIKYTIQRPSRVPITATLLSAAGDAAGKLQAAKLPDRIVFELLAQLIPGLDVDRIMELIAAEPPPPIVVAPPVGSLTENPPAPAAERRHDSNGNGHHDLKDTVLYGNG